MRKSTVEILTPPHQNQEDESSDSSFYLFDVTQRAKSIEERLSLALEIHMKSWDDRLSRTGVLGSMAGSKRSKEQNLNELGF